MTTPWKRFKRGARHIRPWRRHSLVLAFAGLVYLMIGLLMILLPMTDQRAASLLLVLRIAPIEFWGAVWVTHGLAALLSTRWPETSETWGYTAMSGLAAFWAAQFAMGTLLLGGPLQNLNGTLIYGLLAFLWWGISGLRNPEEMPINPVEEPW